MCAHCGKPIAHLITPDEVGWFHFPDDRSRLVARCFPGGPIAEPADLDDGFEQVLAGFGDE